MRNEKSFNATLFTLSECHFETGSNFWLEIFFFAETSQYNCFFFKLLAHHAQQLEDLFEFSEKFDATSTRSL
jgi:hypothetical protein